MKNRPEPSSAQQLTSLVSDLIKAGYSAKKISAETGIAHTTVWRIANGACREAFWATYCKIKAFHSKVIR